MLNSKLVRLGFLLPFPPPMVWNTATGETAEGARIRSVRVVQRHTVRDADATPELHGDPVGLQHATLASHLAAHPV